MSAKGSLAIRTTESADKVREQLDRVVRSKTFHTVERLKRFLLFIVDETLEGRGDRLKEFVVGIQVFGREASFDPRSDPIVRVQARRLRDRLARYYQEEGPEDKLIIELPKGGYSAVFHPREVTPAPPARQVPQPFTNRNTVLVRPFTDLSPDRGVGHICQAIRQELNHQLTKLDPARVLSWNGRDVPGDAPQPLASILVDGSIQRAGDTLRVTVQLIDGGTGAFLWSESIDRPLTDSFALQEEVAQATIGQVRLGLSENRWRRSSAQPENPAAYNFLQQARYHLSHRTEESLRRAADMFERVLAEDPHCATAYSGLANAYSLLGHYGVLAPKDVWNKVASNAAAAVLEDETSAEAHVALAHAQATQDWNWSGAEQEFRRAIRLDPNNATAHHWYAVSCLVPLARLDEALTEIQLACALDPISSIIARDAAVIHYYRREFDQALERCDHTIELNPHFSAAYWTLGLIQEQHEDYEESAAAFRRALQLAPNTPRVMSALGHTLARWGKVDQAREILGELHDLSRDRYVSPFTLALLHYALDEKEVAFDWLRDAFDSRCFELISLKVNPQFDSLKNEPEFVALASRLGV